MDHLASLVTVRMLCDIAEADAGFQSRENLSKLKRIRDDLDFDSPLRFSPMEALAMTRWTEPETDEWLSDKRVGHLERLFACAALLMSATDDETADYILGETDTLIQCVRSSIALGTEVGDHVRRLLFKPAMPRDLTTKVASIRARLIHPSSSG